MQSETFCEKALDALHVAAEVELCVGMRSRDHLREIDDSNLFFLADHQIEFVKVSMNKTILCKLNYELDQTVVHGLRVDQTFNVDHRVCLDKRHHDSVSVCVDRCRCWEPSIVESFHESEFFQGGDAGHIQPALSSSTLKIITVVLNRSEGSASKSSKFYDNRLAAMD